jgi:hypothetical protein
MEGERIKEITFSRQRLPFFFGLQRLLFFENTDEKPEGHQKKSYRET